MCDLTLLPGAMRRHGWTRGPALLERWFNSSPYTKPSYGPPDTTTITMDWVLTFDRARSVSDGMINGRIWLNQRAQSLLTARFRRLGYFTNTVVPFGTNIFTGSASVPSLDPDHIQNRQVGGEVQHLAAAFAIPDDLHAALNRFNLRLLVAGYVMPKRAPPPQGGGQYTVQPNDTLLSIALDHCVTIAALQQANPSLSSNPGQPRPGDVLTIPPPQFSGTAAPGAVTALCGTPSGHVVVITQVGIYAQDSFDFEGLQYLGQWPIRTAFGITVGACHVWNSDFRDWRTSNGKGGDFEVFSDIKATALNPPDSFDVPP
jgi:LysM repeat protein